MSKYRVYWDNGHACDSFECRAKEDAETAMLDVFRGWIDAMSEEDTDEWDSMIYECECIVEEYDEETGEWFECECPSDEDLERIGWIDSDRRNDLLNSMRETTR